MSALRKLEEAGFSVTTVDGQLIISPASRLTDEHRRFIRQSKLQILDELKEMDIHEALEEKAAILEYDAGMSREQAEESAPGAVGVFNYVLSDFPDKVFTILTSGASLAEARRLVEHQHGANRVVDVQLFPWRP